LNKEEKKKHIDVIIQASSKSSIIPLIYIYSRTKKTKYVLENSEYPWFILKKKKSNLFYKILYLGVYYRLFDGFIVMTKNLEMYHLKYCKKSAKMFHMPMTVDINRFNLDLLKENSITYIGNNSYFKDGVDILISAFKTIASKYPNWKLVIIGDTGKDKEIALALRADNLSNRITLKGRVHRDEVPDLLCKSKILALARPNNKQAEGGFPTKLGEYLSTRNLVIVTAVGEIPQYLEDGVSALISEPDNFESFAIKLEEGIINYSKYKTIAEKGFCVCNNVFNGDVQGERLVAYLNSFQKGDIHK